MSWKVNKPTTTQHYRYKPTNQPVYHHRVDSFTLVTILFLLTSLYDKPLLTYVTLSCTTTTTILFVLQVKDCMLNDQTITITELRSRVQGGEARVGELLGLVAEYERKASHYQDDIHALSDKVIYD